MKSLSLFIILAATLFCHSISGAPSVLPLRYINTENGLPGNSVLSIKKDSTGFMWIGTKKGLSRFDGVEIVSYPIPQLTDNIWSIEEADNDTLIVGTLSDVVLFSRKSMICQPLQLPSAVVKAICKIGPSRFWAGTENGLYLIDRHKYNRLHLKSGLSTANHITGILRQNSSVFWFSTADGLLRIDMRDMKPVLFRNPDNNNFFTCLTFHNGSIFLGTFNKGVFKFDIKESKFEKVNGFDHYLVTAIDSKGNSLYIGTNGRGLKKLDLATGEIETIAINGNRRHSADSNTISCLSHHNGAIWIGTQFQGIAYTPRNDYKFRYLNFPGFNSSDYHVRSLMTINDGVKLIGTREGLFLTDIKHKTVKPFSTSDPSSGLRSDIIVSIRRVNGKIMVCTFGGGIHIFNPASQSLHDFSQEDIFLYGCVFGVAKASNGNLWIATQDGLYESSPEGKILRNFNLMNSVLSTNVIFIVYPDKSDRIWVGTNFGLYLLDANDGRMMKDCFSEPIKGEIKYIFEDSRGDLWICTTQDGLYRIGMDLAVKKHYTADDFLPENEVLSIAEDKKGILWVCTRTKITRFNPADSSYYTFKRLDGLNGLDFNNDVEIAGDSIISWPNEGGLICTSLNQSSWKPDFSGVPKITAVIVGGKTYNPPYMKADEKITLPPSIRSVKFKFSDMGFTLPYATAYEYRMEGYDDDWTLITGVNEVTYDNLKPGRYKFLIRLPGQDAASSAFIDIDVSRSYTFITCVVLTALMVISAIGYFCHRIWRLKVKIRNERYLFSKTSKKTEDPDASDPIPVDTNPLMDELLEFMDSEKPYRNPKLSINDVAQHLGCREKELSQLLNANMKMNFSNFINVYRVSDVKSRMTEENLARFTLMTLAEQSGFSSKTTFYRVFKEVIGLTPLQYCQQQGISDKSDLT